MNFQKCNTYRCSKVPTGKASPRRYLHSHVVAGSLCFFRLPLSVSRATNNRSYSKRVVQIENSAYCCGATLAYASPRHRYRTCLRLASIRGAGSMDRRRVLRLPRHRELVRNRAPSPCPNHVTQSSKSCRDYIHAE